MDQVDPAHVLTSVWSFIFGSFLIKLNIKNACNALAICDQACENHAGISAQITHFQKLALFLVSVYDKQVHN